MLGDLPERPEIPEHRLFVWMSFWRLAQDRNAILVMSPSPMGGVMVRPSPQPITTLSIHDWCDRHGIGGDELHAFRQMIDAMDRAWREEVASHATAATPAD